MTNKRMSIFEEELGKFNIAANHKSIFHYILITLTNQLKIHCDLNQNKWMKIYSGWPYLHKMNCNSSKMFFKDRYTQNLDNY